MARLTLYRDDAHDMGQERGRGPPDRVVPAALRRSLEVDVDVVIRQVELCDERAEPWPPGCAMPRALLGVERGHAEPKAFVFRPDTPLDSSRRLGEEVSGR